MTEIIDYFAQKAEEEVDYFSGGETAVPSVYSPGQEQRTSTLAALAYERLGLGDPTESFASVSARSQENIRTGREEAMRLQIGGAAQAYSADTVRGMQDSVMKGELQGSLFSLVSQELDLRRQQGDLNALESEGIAMMQDKATQNSTVQRDVFEKAMAEGDILEQSRWHMQQAELFNRELDKISQGISSQTTLGYATDFLALPFQTWWSSYSAVPTVSKVLAIPGENLEEQSRYLWSLPPGEFEAELSRVVERVRSNSGVFSENLSVAQQVLASLYKPDWYNTQGLNFWTAVDTSVVPVGAVARMIKSPLRTMAALGDRAGASKLAAEAIVNETRGGEPTLQGVLRPEDTIQGLVPSSELVGEGSSISGEVVTKIRAMEKAARDFETNKIQGASPEQIEEAYTRAIEAETLRWKSNGEQIIDMEKLGRWNIHDNRALSETWDAKFEPFADASGLASRASSEAAEEIDELTRVTQDNWSAMSVQKIIQKLGISPEDAAKVKSGEIVVRDEHLPKRSIPTSPVRAGRQPTFDPTFERSLDEATGTHKLSFYLGTESTNGGFAFKEAAEMSAKDRGLGGVDIVERNGQWFVKVTTDVQGHGVGLPTVTAQDFGNVGPWSKKIKGAWSWMPDLFNSLRLQGVLERTRLQKELFAPLVQNVSKLNKEGLEGLEKVLSISEHEQKWFSVDDFTKIFERQVNRPPTETETLAYYGIKTADDTVFSILNNNRYIDLNRRGVKTVSARNDATGFNTGEMNGVEIDVDSIGQFPVYDVDNGKYLFPKRGDFKGVKTRLDSGQTRLLRLDGGDSDLPLVDGDRVKYILVSKGSSTVGPLRRQQMSYVAGGPREYPHKWFVKQGVIKKFSNGNGRYMMNPKVHMTGNTKKELDDIVIRYNRAIVAYKKLNGVRANDDLPDEFLAWENEGGAVGRSEFNLDDAKVLELKRIISESPAGTYEKFDELVQNGEIQLNTRMEVTYDKANPSVMKRAGGEVGDWSDVEEDSVVQYYNSKGRMYYSQKKERLKDPQGRYADILDPYAAINRAMSHAMQVQSFGDYNRRLIDEWERLAKPYLTNEADFVKAPPGQRFFSGVIDLDLKKNNPMFYQQLEATRWQHKNFLGFQTDQMASRELMYRRLADWVESKPTLNVKDSKGVPLSRKVLSGIDKNPVSFLRSMVFDPIMGFFDPGQIIVQTQTIFSAMAIHPVYGARMAPLAAGPLQWLMRPGATAAHIDYLAKALKPIHGMEVAEFKAMVQDLKRSGWGNVSGDFAQLDHYANTIGGSMIRRNAENFREKGRFLFYQAERANRFAAHGIAWKVIRKEQPGLKIGSPEFINAVRTKTEVLSANMTTASKAMWQQGLASVPTQFMSYQARMLELMLPKSFGGSKALSNGQKGRLAVGQLVLYGAGGLPLGDAVYQFARDQYQTATGEDLSPEMHRVMSKGFWDSAAHYMTDGELDLDFSGRVGQGSAWNNLYDKLSEGKLASFLDVALGATGSIATDMGDAAEKMMLYFRAEQIDKLSPELWGLAANDIAKLVNSWSRAEKAYFIWKTGLLVDEKTGNPIVDAAKMEGFAALLGIPLKQETERWDIINDKTEKQEHAKKVAEIMANNIRLAMRALVDGDEKSAQHYSQIASGVMQAYHDEPLFMQQILQERTQIIQFGKTNEWDNIMRQLMLQTGKTPQGGQ